MSIAPLSPDMTRDVLLHLGVQAGVPTLELLNELITAYTETVPWESAFRIAKKARTPVQEDCPRWSEEFWRDSIELGGGGTCYESNYAFFRLLLALGYEGYLTVNNMNESIGCHTAIMLNLNGEKWLADVGLPIFTALPINPDAVTERDSPYMHYTITPQGEGRYEIMRVPHPRTYAFTLIDVPVDERAYRAATTNDYGENGLFLDRVIVNKVIDGTLRRFNSADLPPRFEMFDNGELTDYEITADVPKAVSRHFGMDEDTVRAAFEVVSKS